ncbi:dihydrodipicolinate synthase family protein [soil metagenome]
MTAGVYSIAPTPFDQSGAVDLTSIDTMTNYYTRCGVHGLTILGQLGEAAKLDPDESAAIVKRILDRVQFPVVVGVSAPGFAAMRRLARTVMDLGAGGVMVAPPNTLRTDDQIVDYYAGVVDAIGGDVPFVIQDYPLVFSVQMSVGVIKRVAQNHSNCVMLKHEDWPGLEKISALRELEHRGEMPRLSILCGNGGLFLDFEAARGADGAMTGYAFPEMLLEVLALSTTGETDRAHDVFDAHLPLLRYEQQPGVGLAVRKYVMFRRGIIADDFVRSPGGTLTDTAKAEVDLLMTRLSRRCPELRI